MQQPHAFRDPCAPPYPVMQQQPYPHMQQHHAQQYVQQQQLQQPWMQTDGAQTWGRGDGGRGGNFEARSGMGPVAGKRVGPFVSGGDVQRVSEKRRKFAPDEKANSTDAQKGGGGSGSKKGGKGFERELATTKQVLNKLGAALPGESEKDIEKWVAARKRNWPSRANVERKLAEAAERAARGELSKAKRKRSGTRGRTSATGSRVDAGKDYEAERHATVGATPINALSALAQDYGTSDSEEGELPDRKVESITPSTDQAGGCEPAPNRATKENQSKNAKKRTRRGRATRGGKRGAGSQPRVQQKPTRPSLLRKLLEKEIFAEQSALLQAFRHIVER